MNENETQRSDRRRRGGRRRSKDRGERAETRSAPQQTPPPTLWQKIISFFTGKSKSSSTAKAAPVRQYPPYEPRQQQRKTARRRDEQRSPRFEGSSEPRPSRKPEAVEVTTPKLYVGNLSFETTESDLFELFKGIGAVQNAEIVTHKESEKSKGFGFVLMTTVDERSGAVS
jgi:RNA recognition motif-containing protein